MGSFNQSGFKKSNYGARLVVSTMFGVVFGFIVGTSFPSVTVTKINLAPRLLSPINVAIGDDHNSGTTGLASKTVSVDDSQTHGSSDSSKIHVATNPRGAETLPPGIVVSETDFYLRRLWGNPNEDLDIRPRYLVTFTVGFDQRNNIDAAVKKFSENFTILLFHYDGRVSEWDQFEWSQHAVHISVKKQTKWWYAKRFLHPDVVGSYDYIFIWDEDLGVEHFDAEKYLHLVKKHGLEISQPGLEPNKIPTWQMTKRRNDTEVHKETKEREGWCSNPRLPPCAAFVEIMAPVFSRNAWHCVWHLIQNDLVHGWGLDFALRRCVEPAHERIGVVDLQWVDHQVIPSLGNQGQSEPGKAPWQGVRERCQNEWMQFRSRLEEADHVYLAEAGKG